MQPSEVNGLALPPLLVELLLRDQWRHPGDEVLEALIPFLREPVVFLPSVEEMHFESSWFYADELSIPELLHVVRGSQQATPTYLPWLDAEQAFFIAVNRFPGDDLGIALDYRTSAADPRVVASDWGDSSEGCLWRVVTPTFSQFVKRLSLGAGPI